MGGGSAARLQRPSPHKKKQNKRRNKTPAPRHPRRHFRKLLAELVAIAGATRGRLDFPLDLSPVGEDFDPEAEV